MRTWVKYVALVAAGGVFASSAMAADHRDGSDTSPGTKAEPAADINDVFTFMDEDGNLVLMGSMGGTDDAAFSDAVQYVFHIGRSADALGTLIAPAADETLVLCEFASETEASCYVGTPGEEATAVVTGDPSPNTGMGDASLKVHAGHHKDPFYFYLTGFNHAITYVDAVFTALPGLEGRDGCPDLTPDSTLAGTADVPAGTSFADTITGMLTDNGLSGAPWDATGNSVGAGATDDFLNNNIAGLVVSISPTLIAGTGEYYQVWMSTHKR